MGLEDVLSQIDPYIAYVTPLLQDLSEYLGIDINVLIFIGLSLLLLLLYVLYAAFTPVAKRRGKRIRRGEVQRRAVFPRGTPSTAGMGVQDLGPGLAEEGGEENLSETEERPGEDLDPFPSE
jgi:hypothetical protein